MIDPRMQQAFTKIAEEQFVLYFNSLPNSQCRLLLKSEDDKDKSVAIESRLIACGNFGENPRVAILLMLDNSDRPRMLRHLGSAFLLENRYAEAGENIWYFFTQKFFKKIDDTCQKTGIPSSLHNSEIIKKPQQIAFDKVSVRRSEFLVTFQERDNMTCRISMLLFFKP